MLLLIILPSVKFTNVQIGGVYKAKAYKNILKRKKTSKRERLCAAERSGLIQQSQCGGGFYSSLLSRRLEKQLQ